MSLDLTTDLAGVALPNPVLTAAGCAGSGKELDPFIDVGELGAFVTRSVTLDPRAGRPAPRMVEAAAGMLSAVGLQGPGLQSFLATELPWLVQRGARAVVSIAGSTLGEYGELARRVASSPGVTGIEVNLSVGNDDKGGRSFATDTYQAAKVVSLVRRDVPRGLPVLAKLACDPHGVVSVAEAVVKAGADGLVLGDTVPGMAIDPHTLRPALGAVTGGLSGPAMHPLAVRCVWEVRRALPDVPVVGVGGVRTGFDALELLLAGACAVQLGTVVLTDPSAPTRVLAELRAELEQRQIARVADVVGHAHLPEGELP